MLCFCNCVYSSFFSKTVSTDSLWSLREEENRKRREGEPESASESREKELFFGGSRGGSRYTVKPSADMLCFLLVLFYTQLLWINGQWWKFKVILGGNVWGAIVEQAQLHNPRLWKSQIVAEWMKEKITQKRVIAKPSPIALRAPGNLSDLGPRRGLLEISSLDGAILVCQRSTREKKLLYCHTTEREVKITIAKQSRFTPKLMLQR